MNRIYRSIWNDQAGTFVAASENANSGGKKSSPGTTAVAGGARFALKRLAVGLMLAFWTLLPIYNMVLIALSEDGDEFTGTGDVAVEGQRVRGRDILT